MDQKINAVGYQDYWNRAFALNPSFYEKQVLLHPQLQRFLANGESQPLSKTVRSITYMLASSYSAISILTLNGHGVDAMRIARSMFEGAVTASYLVKEPSELEAYLAFTKVSAKKLLDYTLMFDGSTNAFDDQQKAKINADYSSVRHLFPGNPTHVPSSWCRLQVVQMFERVGVGTWYKGFYHLASSLVHMDARGMYMHFGLDEDDDPVFRFPPCDDLIQQAIAATRVAMNLVLRAYGDCTENAESRTSLLQLAESIIS